MGGMTGGTGGMPGGTGGTPVYGNPLEGSPQATKVDGKAGIDSEGPLWIVDGGYLLFSDVSNGKMWKLEPAKPAGSRLSEFSDYKPGTKTNGLALDADGNLLVCERETGKVGKMKLSTKAKSFFAETFNGQPFKAPNDIVVGKNGNVYFSDPIWGSASGSTLSAGAYRVDKQGTVHLITTGASKPGNPNGIALSPDEKTLYVGDDMAGKVWKYAVASDGATSSPMEFASLATPDGIAIDNAGNVYVTSNSNTRAVIVYKPDGMKIGQINLPGRPSNASFGGLDMKTLYMTVAADIYSVQLGVPGIP
jgi:gluconolactonase